MYLALEVSTAMASVALTDGDQQWWTRDEATHEGHGAGLMPIIAALCAEAGVTAADLRGVAVALGPGTFTGLRVGLAVAKGIALGRNIPLVGVPTLEALAEAAAADLAIPADAFVVPLLDARRNEVYVAAYGGGVSRLASRVSRNTVDEMVAPQVIAPDQLGQVLPMSATCVCVGPGFAAYQSIIATTLGARCHALSQSITPTARSVAQLALPRLRAGQGDPVDALVPLYVRASYAEK